MNHKTLAAAGAIALASCASSNAPAPGQPLTPVQVPAFAMPSSSYASPEANAIAGRLVAAGSPLLPSIGSAREHYGKFNDERLLEMRRAFSTVSEQKLIGGVKVDWVTPSEGIAPANKDRVLINLHGGGFMWGSGSGALIEAIPVAATARIAVATVDYRLAPEHRFPAASEDVAAVYKELLKSYRPENIGIYGCSAGGVLTSQMIAWFRAHDLPQPGAIATLCGTAHVAGGDSMYFAAAGAGEKPPRPDEAGPRALPTPYMDGVPLNDPLGYPVTSEEVLRCFPPTLLIAGGRDFAWSMLTVAHRRLAALDIHSELYLFDGLWHAFFMYPDMPESRETYGLIARFFERQLGKPGKVCGKAAG